MSETTQIQNPDPLGPANKGEWSELYALLKILEQGYIDNGDENLEPIAGYRMAISEVYREENMTPVVYKIYQDHVSVEISQRVIVKKDKQELASGVKSMFEVLKKSSGTFYVPELQDLFSSLFVNKVKAASNSKQDIEIRSEIVENGLSVSLGFSIKSQLGSPSTLFNASRTTNVVFKLEHNLDIALLNEINAVKDKAKFHVRVKSITELTQISLHAFDNHVFRSNLYLIDSMMPCYYAELVLNSLKYNIHNLKELTQLIADLDPFGLPLQDKYAYYENMTKKLLMDIALGMVPGTPWNCTYNASGGYIVVKSEGSLVCYHIYRLNDFRDYLFHNTAFDSPSSSRHDYGYIYQEAGSQYIKLNRQIRFTH